MIRSVLLVATSASRTATATALAAQGYWVWAAADLATAIEVLLIGPPDVVLLEASVPPAEAAAFLTLVGLEWPSTRTAVLPPGCTPAQVATLLATLPLSDAHDPQAADP